MAEFCRECIVKMYPNADPDRNGMRHDSPGELLYDVCEGCGPGWFDHTGRKVEEDRPKKRPESA